MFSACGDDLLHFKFLLYVWCRICGPAAAGAPLYQVAQWYSRYLGGANNIILSVEGMKGRYLPTIHWIGFIALPRQWTPHIKY